MMYFIHIYTRLKCLPLLCFIPAAFMLVLSSCGGTDKSPEQKAYDTMCSSLKFKSYKTLSENTIPPILLVYNSTAHKDDMALSEGVLRLLIGYSWAVNDKPEYAVAESKIIQDLSTDDKDLKVLAHSLEAMALYEKGWKTLAGDESVKASALLNKMPDSLESTGIKKIAFHMLLGTLCIYEQNFNGANFHFSNFNKETKIEWPYLLSDALAGIKSGEPRVALKKIKAIAENKDVPEDVRKFLLDATNTAEKNIKDIKPEIFWTKLISQSLYNSIKSASVSGINKISELMENIREKLKIE